MMRIVIFLALMCGCGWSEEAGPAPVTPPWLPGHQRPEEAFFAWTAPVITAIKPDGSSDIAILEETLKNINQDVARTIVTRGIAEGDQDFPNDPTAEAGWRLWAFWSVDMPGGKGMATALAQVRASNEATIRLCHLTTLRGWESMLWRSNAYREQILAARNESNVTQAQIVFSAWKEDIEPADALAKVFYGKGVPVVPDVRPAIALRVRTVPCFRLISDKQRIHALDGFEQDVDLVAWVRNCRAWEAREDQRAGGGP